MAAVRPHEDGVFIARHARICGSQIPASRVIVLNDIGLPGIDGYEVARRIRSQRGTAPILVAISGYGQAEDRRHSLEAGFDAHLTKPVSADHLSDVLATLFRSGSIRAAPEYGCAPPGTEGR